jgi:hypothetical protein
MKIECKKIAPSPDLTFENVASQIGVPFTAIAGKDFSAIFITSEEQFNNAIKFFGAKLKYFSELKDKPETEQPKEPDDYMI